jgi:hypothetical protein
MFWNPSNDLSPFVRCRSILAIGTRTQDQIIRGRCIHEMTLLGTKSSSGEPAGLKRHCKTEETSCSRQELC